METRQNDNDFNISPTDRMKKNFSRRRWSDSPTLLRGSDLRPNGQLQLVADHDLTQSLHDLSEPILQPVSKVSSGSQNNLSTLTIQSDMGTRTKSQDSGFNKSASYLSLQSTSRKYSHVESKVKKYVQNIKEAEALRKKSRSTQSVNNCVSPPSVKESESQIEIEGNPHVIIDKLQSELRDKDELIKALQGSYEDLLLEHAKAENKIDLLRLRSLQSSPARPCQSHPFDSDDFPFKQFYSPEKSLMDRRMPTSALTPKLSSSKETAEDSVGYDGLFSPSLTESVILSPPSLSDEKLDMKTLRSKEVVISAPLGPIQKLYSSSVRIDKVVQPLGHFSSKSDDSISTPIITEIQPLPKVAVEMEGLAEDKEASEIPSEDFGGAKSNIQYTTADTGLSNNLYHVTTDTGIEDCVQSTDKDTADHVIEKTDGRLPLSLDLKHIPDIPNEDPFSKVQRWRDSLPDDITDRMIETNIKLKKTRNRKPTLQRKTVGVQTCESKKIAHSFHPLKPPVHFCDPLNSLAFAKLTETSDNDDYAESLEITDCDNYSTETSHKGCKKQLWKTEALRNREDKHVPRSKSLEPPRSHQCCGDCKTCGGAIVADGRPVFELPSSSTSYLSPKEREEETPKRKSRSGGDKTEKIRRDPICRKKSVRCSRITGAQVTRAVLLDMLLNVQTTHSCCCCCQHRWRGRQLSFPVSKDEPLHEPIPGKVSDNALQKCLADIQKIAWELNAKLAASHAGLVNLSSRKSE